MSKGFVHSIPVPRLYKIAAKTVRQVTEEGASLKQLIYEKKHPNLKGVYALATTTLHNGGKLNEIIRKSQILFKEPRFDPWLARVLITELIWGKGVLKNESKPVQTILTYEQEIRQHLQDQGPEPPEKWPKQKAQKPRYIRINTLVKSVEDAIEGFQEDGYELLPKPDTYEEFLHSLKSLGNWSYPVFIQDFHVNELFAFPSGTHFYAHPGYQSGAIVLQDKASCLPAYLLNPEPWSTVLDMCAAPGMKTTHLAAILQNRGKVLSVERNERRYQVLCDMIAHANADCVETLHLDALTLTPQTCGDVEYILVDPSCSGSGMERSEFEDNQDRCTPDRLKRLQSFQVLLLRHALFNFPKVKRVVYSTCSIYPEENEMVVDEILEDIGQAYNLVPVKDLLKGQWINFSSQDYQCRDSCLYAKSDVDQSNGFFVAVFDRNPEVALSQHKKKYGNGRSTRKNGEETRIDEGTDSTGRDNRYQKKRKNKGREDINDDDYGEADIDRGSKKRKVPGVETSENYESQGQLPDHELAEENLLSEERANTKSKKKRKKDIVQEEVNLPEGECDNGETVGEIGALEREKKKKRKRKHEKSEVDAMSGDQTDQKFVDNRLDNCAEEADESPVPAKKSKKKKSKHGKNEKKSTEEYTRSYTNSLHEGHVQDNVSDPEKTEKLDGSKKRKSKKKTLQEELSLLEVNSVAVPEVGIDDELVDSVKTKKKKKKKDQKC
ncbi:28S rRNA (cytosine-C(5))-methyltransferase [Diachasmimorpha longicaudata]|uniref:28S rRNA (cytosine-C(5))-methyltransferase n=1 Tax=Diachasmimorpha longicaudata TaxID=58733 RepID=UPI0030B877E7